MNSELVKQALEKVGNPNILVNLISRRVRQLTAGGGGINRPLVLNTGNLGMADIALREIVEEKMGWESAGSDDLGAPHRQEAQEILGGEPTPNRPAAQRPSRR